MLEIVSEALKVNNIQHTLCLDKSKDFNSARGGIELFRNNVDVRVLLLPMSLGAEGLDLIIASHVFLLEPLLNQNQELQAVNRIDRIGQMKATYIHKYVIKETIEEKILRFQEKQFLQQEVKSPSKGKRKSRGKGDDQILELEDIRDILDIA